MKKHLAIAAAAIALLGASAASANDFAPQIEKFYAEQIKAKMSEQVVIQAIKDQNVAHSSLTDEAIDGLDKTWRAEAEAGGGDLIQKVLSNQLSSFLKELKDAHPAAITEVFVMDNKGLNVGQSDVTSDYMQGDEGKWKKTYAVGPNAVFIDEVEFDDSTGAFQSQVSATIVDPATGEAIGAVTIGLNVEEL